jgi:tetratricopeptide (TPR) repeat protein
MEKEVLQNYLEKLIMLQDGSQERFTEENFRIAIDSLGLSEAEKKELDKEFDQQFKRGSNYYRSNNFKAAVRHLETAKKIEPFHLATHLLLTDSYKMLYLKTGSEEHYERVITLCKQGLNMQSHNPYFAKIETYVEQYHELRKRRFWRLGMAAFMIVAIVLGAAGGYWYHITDNNTLMIAAAVMTTLMVLTPVPLTRQYFILRKRIKNTGLTLKFVPKR